mmetsp:Transcript_10367/g.22853  ORF Transcript_10367/g.22853 Transcript_10367/m.22853 type:complete len:214 (+) Transcript_10367:203-844(+)|eukprot:CAMPEP_0194777702 /NCGR_PEP_ID=MMETSP0323_2-20130528/66304_1 /TAXON_ID=2866 ORGANISM="Crypthecodinium cohnii, Strain Seligo" /NCGR_SAMPLE_ID=MMETSP0323_2 /ASSEMBLY_ACC=CAM_ASM_000346 /LENGTH=213 /DNA_ID=CAMNT_0039714581 /DNA_START=91 /DNA_END=732 /DNA_ORIENTATION=+
MAGLIRTSCFTRLSLPLRALAPSKKKAKKMKKTAVAQQDIPLAPYIPPELSKETRHFFNNQNRFKALLDLVFSPVDPQDTEEDRRKYEEAKMEFDAMQAKMQSIYEAHERRAEARMWKAIHQLPEDLYEEAVRSKPDHVPEPLLFHQRHHKEIFDSLNEDEKRKLQVYQNLMYVRYPHAAEKARNRDRFFIPENQIVSRQKEAAMAKMKLTKR